MKEENGWEELEMEINDEIKKMAAAYHSMNIPDELKDRVLESIRKGKEKAPELEGEG